MVIWSWLLLILVTGAGVGNIARGVLAIRLVPVVADLTSLPFNLLGLIYIVWGVAFLVLAFTLLRRPERGGRWVRLAAVAYQATVWGIRILGDVSTYARQLWLRDFILSLLFLLTVFALTAFSDRQLSRRWRSDD
jgi:hypothetical protein